MLPCKASGMTKEFLQRDGTKNIFVVPGYLNLKMSLRLVCYTFKLMCHHLMF